MQRDTLTTRQVGLGTLFLVPLIAWPFGVEKVKSRCCVILMVAGIDDLIIGGLAGWAISTTLDGMLEQIVELEDALSEKLDRLLQSPYVTGKNALQLALEYSKAKQVEKMLHQLDRATEYFDQAGSQLNGLEQIHSYCLAGMCSFLRQDEIAKKHYFSLALQSLLALQGNELSVIDYLRSCTILIKGCAEVKNLKKRA